jgi:hypothetical protein
MGATWSPDSVGLTTIALDASVTTGAVSRGNTVGKPATAAGTALPARTNVRSSRPAANGLIATSCPFNDSLSTPARTTGADVAANATRNEAAITDNSAAGCRKSAHGALTHSTRIDQPYPDAGI